MTTTDLTQRIETSNRRQQFILALLVIAIIIIQAALLVLVLQANQRIEDRAKQIADTEKAIQEQHRQQDDYLQCIASFYSGVQPPPNCHAPFVASTEVATPANAPTQSATQTPPQATQSTPVQPKPAQPTPQPQPQRTPFQQLLHTLSGGLL